MTQEDLANEVHVNFYHIGKIEQGRVRPSSDLIVDIANVLNVSVDDLLIGSLQSLSSSTVLHQLLKDCSPAEETIIVRNAESLKQILKETDR